ncbi:N-acetylglutamate synthase-like GNAT family acetyltransferase [Anseongella ginsenosidimutans]|uniref:N-acetylglutamate synthase-like GNAT family acetyltransferase n=1 Tax=Anseongella ginsenosidimutans TaxID=496056 RepID=A0A4R3KX64_9SPHI|nr:GNAT family N-acetyltransferase [Anseongella ginsenosidimutans]QEC50942.1 GNAT family N-acetyltransferase [Anseongella ginsenosidimutans]TCS90417.1 N-acetylglutamate synthase-like GNAT family acetyltransferase [Anseongella ginsenosidimutans]
MEYQLKAGFEQMDVQAVHEFLSRESYWAKDIPLRLVEESLKNSWCLGAFDQNGRQAGFARLITDYTTFAYLADVFVLETHRGQGISKTMMEYIMQEPWVKNLRRLMLATIDAHGLYQQYGFVPLDKPERFLEISRKDLYGAGEAESSRRGPEAEI